MKDSKTGKFSIVRAKEAVVVSGGSINSPAILLRSGLKGSRIGKNLHLHPVTYITGYYAEVINPWEGSIMTAVSVISLLALLLIDFNLLLFLRFPSLGFQRARKC